MSSIDIFDDDAFVIAESDAGQIGAVNEIYNQILFIRAFDLFNL